jgi:ribonuclease HI
MWHWFCALLPRSPLNIGKANLGNGTKNKGEFQALLELLKCVVRWNFHDLQVFRDSKLTVAWRNGDIHLTNLDLMMIGQNLKSWTRTFQSLLVTHVYKENNVVADSLSKEALSMPEYKLFMKEHVDGEVTSHHEDIFVDM